MMRAPSFDHLVGAASYLRCGDVSVMLLTLDPGFAALNPGYELPHSLNVARTSAGKSSSGVTRRAVKPWSWAKRQKASSVGRFPSTP
jgi:hypothetical protein